MTVAFPVVPYAFEHRSCGNRRFHADFRPSVMSGKQILKMHRQSALGFV